MYYVGDKAKALDILNQYYGPLTREQENQILSATGSLDLGDVVVRVTNVDYTRPITLPKRKLQAALPEEQGAEQFLELVEEAKQEAYEAFLQENYMQQEASERGIAMETLWDEVGRAFTEEYWAGAAGAR